jgi:protease I
MKKALIITWEKFQDHELIYPYYSLLEHGFDVTLMANKAGPILGSMGTHMNCNFATSELSEGVFDEVINNHELMVVPGGVKALEKLRQEKPVCALVRMWDRLEKTIFVVCNGTQLLISADILIGRTVSGYYAIQPDIENAGATYKRDNVVVDKNIVSCPHYNFMGEWLRTGYQVHDKRMRGE